MRKLFAMELLLVLMFGSSSIGVLKVIADDNILFNGDFELCSLDGWVANGDVVLVQDTLDPYTVKAMHTVAQGRFSAKIGDEIPWAQRGPQSSSISQEAVVPSLARGQSKVVIQFSYAVVANDPPSHEEYDKPFFKATVRDLTTNEILYDTDYVYTISVNLSWRATLIPLAHQSDSLYQLLEEGQQRCPGLAE